jgi:predicted transcriptional regulator
MATNLTAHDPFQSGDRRANNVTQGQTSTVADEELLELLGDEYTRKVLQSIVSEPKSGSEVVEDAAVSKATAYRRLETLQEAGLVESRTVFDPDGHHHKQFQAVIDGVTVEIEDEGLSADIHKESRAAGD